MRKGNSENKKIKQMNIQTRIEVRSARLNTQKIPNVKTWNTGILNQIGHDVTPPTHIRQLNDGNRENMTSYFKNFSRWKGKFRK